jgi:hypothetical protein
MAGAAQLSKFARDLELRLLSGGAPLAEAEAGELAQMFGAYSDALKEKGLAA